MTFPHRFSAIAFLAALPALGIPIYINDPSAVTNGAYGGTQRFEARFRVSDTAWDIGLGPALPITGQKTANLGTVASVLSPLWRFELRSDPALGLRFRVQPSASAPWTTLLWATGEEIGTWTPFERAFNTLRVQVYAIGNAATARNAILENLVFSTGPLQGYAEEQGLTNMTVTRTTPSSTFSNFPSDVAGTNSHWIYSSGNLAAQAWRLSGTIDFNSLSGNPGNNLRLSIFGSQYTFNQLPAAPALPVPEPSPSLPLALALAGFAGARCFRLDRCFRRR